MAVRVAVPVGGTQAMVLAWRGFRLPASMAIPTSALTARVQDRAQVPFPVWERSAFAESRVRDEKWPEEARPDRTSMACSVLKLLSPLPNPLPHGRRGRLRSVSNGKRHTVQA